ncbi:hypothetical protein MUK42_34291 [Musa troglodytarum]|uniref:Uncharacterized protein n=1 Tax=Musa troglodytarum TaxID=320322 RepID=A0A9E7H4B6_9LILI|nr:hypothetical protein MUK42_34291 [Musa troglodytarum]
MRTPPRARARARARVHPPPARPPPLTPTALPPHRPKPPQAGMVIWRGLPWVYYYDVYTNCHGIPDQQSSNPTR